MKLFNLLTWTQGCPYYKAAIANIFPQQLESCSWCDSMAEEYLSKLSPEDKSGYLRKSTLSSEKVLPDPYSLKASEWIVDLLVLPSITWPDIYSYLIEMPERIKNIILIMQLTMQTKVMLTSDEMLLTQSRIFR
jgi:hypothetical protein